MIVVLGAGVVGLLTAHYLAARGDHVAVVDRESAPAEACSRGNAGIVAIGHAEAWAGPDAPGRLLRAAFGRDPAIKIASFWDLELMRWGGRFLANCTKAAHRRNSDRLLRLSTYSRELLRSLEDELALEYGQQHAGSIYFFQDPRQFEARLRSLDGAARDAGAFRELSAAAIVELEPALAPIAADLAGGFLSSGDFSGDCHLFCRALASHLRKNNRVRFCYDTDVTRLRIEKGLVKAVETASGPDLDCDTVVVALGAGTPRVLMSAGARAPIYPVKGYSATYPVTDSARAPKLSGVDETALVGFARYGDRLRLTAMAEFAGGDLSTPRARLQVLDRYAASAFAGAIDLTRAEHWAGSRPSTPQGPPYLGRLKHCPNLWVNAGHGQLGWTMAAGSGRIVADLIGGRRPGLTDVSAEAAWLERA